MSVSRQHLTHGESIQILDMYTVNCKNTAIQELSVPEAKNRNFMET